MTDADRCRSEGWGPNTVLVGTDGGRTCAAVITAVGEGAVLGRVFAVDDRGWRPFPCGEGMFSLVGDWRRAMPGELGVLRGLLGRKA